MRDDLIRERDGKVPVRRERLIIERIVWDSSLPIFLITLVGILSRSHDELNVWDSKLVISSWVAGVKEVKEVEGKGDGWWAGVRIGLVCKLKWNFDIFLRSREGCIERAIWRSVQDAIYVTLECLRVRGRRKLKIFQTHRLQDGSCWFYIYVFIVAFICQPPVSDRWFDSLNGSFRCLSIPLVFLHLSTNWSGPATCFRGHMSVAMYVSYGLLLAMGLPIQLSPVSAQPLEILSSSIGCVASTRQR